jgi:hypothetical protein
MSSTEIPDQDRSADRLARAEAQVRNLKLAVWALFVLVAVLTPLRIVVMPLLLVVSIVGGTLLFIASVIYLLDFVSRRFQ